MSDDDIERRLRASLSAHAADAPSGDRVADEIVRQALDRGSDAPTVLRPRGGWRTWTTPLLAAAAVAAIAAAVFGTSHLHNSAEPAAPSLSTQPTDTTIVPAPILTPAVTPTPALSGRLTPPATLTPSAGLSGTSGLAGTFQPPAPAGPAKLMNFRAVDATFIGTDDGWALGTADCLTGTGTCPAMMRSTDGGQTWTSMPQPTGAQIGADGIENIRFATDQIGYAYGPNALYMTIDAGATWAKQPGGAIALETADHNVIRVTSPHTGCPGPCDVRVETAPVGSADWTPATLPGGYPEDGLQFVRAGSDAYLLFFGNPAGGAERATSVLFRSSDDGKTWTRSGEPCPQTRLEVDSIAIATGGGAVNVLCEVRQDANNLPANRLDIAISTDGGVHFAAKPGALPWQWVNQLAGYPSGVLIAAGVNGGYRSTDGGTSWQPIPELRGQRVSFAGFENQTIGKLITNGGRTIWLTTDAGRTWTPVPFTH